MTLQNREIVEIDLDNDKVIVYCGERLSEERENPHMVLLLKAITNEKEFLKINDLAMRREYSEFWFNDTKVETSAKLPADLEERTAWRR